LGIFAPMSLYFCGLCRKSTISCSASLASSSPATSLNLMPVSEATYILALLLPKDMALGPTPPIFFIRKREASCPTSTIMPRGTIQLMRKERMGFICRSRTWPNSHPASYSRSTRFGSLKGVVAYSAGSSALSRK